MAKMTDDELRALTDAEMQDASAEAGYGGLLAAARAKSEYYFQGLAKGDLAPPEIEGRSSVVDTTVANTVLGMHGPLMKIFCGTDHVVEFAETHPDDEQKAKQATEYLNYLLRKKNPGYMIIYTWIMDALKSKVGFIKVWWDDAPVETTEEYRGQTDVQLAILLDDGEIEVTGQRAYVDEDAAKQRAQMLEQAAQQLQQMAAGDPQQFAQAQQQFAAMQQQPELMLYDITVKRTRKGGRLCIENIPPDEMFVSRSCKDIDDETFKGHRVRRTVGYLRDRGYDVDDISFEDPSQTAESAERDRYGLQAMLTAPGEAQDPDARQVWLEECYVHGNLDGDGPALFKVMRAGGQILDREKVDANPFVDLASIPLPHQFFGWSPADLAMPHQKIKTSLKRSVLDNLYLQVNGRYWAVPDQVNIDDLLNSRPGGVVRVKNPQGVGRLDQGVGDIGSAMTMMEAAERDAEEATGYTRQSQGGGMQVAQTATQSNIVTNRADERLELVARTMAETGFARLFKKMLRLVSQYQNKAEQVKLSGGWVDVDPREWTNQFDMAPGVGLGTGNKDQLVQHLMALKQSQVTALQIGYATPANLFAADKKLTEALGFRDADRFFTDPTQMPQKQEQQDPAMVKAQLDAQARKDQLQFEREKAQMLAQVDLQAAEMKARAQMEVDRNRQELEAQQQTVRIQLEAEQAERDAQRRHDEQMAKIEFEREKLAFEQWKVNLQHDADIVKAQIAAQQQSASLEAAETQSNQDMAANGNA
jgi:hypothetical protein